MSRFSVGLCGLSQIAARRPATSLFGRVPVSHAAAYAAHPSCDVTAVCDLRPDLVKEFRDTWADTWPTVAGYAELHELLEEGPPDILSVATPDDGHVEPVIAAAEAGVRGIFCEKPIATSLAEADRMLAAVAAHGAYLVVDHNRRYEPLFHQVRHLLRLGELGELKQVRACQTGPRAMLFRYGTHAADMLCFLADSRVVEVSGRLEPGYDHWDRYRGDGGHESLGEPSGSFRCRFANGVTGAYDGVRGKDRGFWFELLTTEAVVQIQPRYATLTREGRTEVLVAEPFDTCGLAAAVSELLHLVRYGGASISGGEQARHALEILVAVLHSHRQGGRPVALPLAGEA